MEDYIFIGKIVNTHGIKGELRILSNFKYKNKVFVQNRRIYIGECKDEEIIVTYRKHKIFDMITMEGYNNINDVLKFLNKDVYVKKNDIDLGDGEYLDEDLIDLSILLDNEIDQRMMDLGGAIDPADIPAEISRSGFYRIGHAHVGPFDHECYKRVCSEL